MSRMSKAQVAAPMEHVQPEQLRSRRKRRIVTRSRAQFERAFADALRDILRDEMSLAS
jgi:hypothetical protein